MELPRDVETWIMWLTYAPLVGASVVGFALAMIKFVEFRRTRAFGDERQHLLDLIARHDLQNALAAAEAQSTPGARVVAAILRQSTRSAELLKDRANQVGSVIVREMEAGLGGLALVASLGPLFGLFGTVVGITIVFNRLSAAEGVTVPQQLAGGISTALYTTIFGLIIGVFALVCHRYFTARLDRLVGEIEAVGLDVVERLTEGGAK